MTVYQTIERFVVDELLIGSRSQIKPDESLISSGILDSIGLLRLLAFIEERFGVRLEDEEMIPDNLETIGVIVDLIGRKTQSRNSS